jgi:hypothetical protein
MQIDQNKVLFFLLFITLFVNGTPFELFCKKKWIKYQEIKKEITWVSRLCVTYFTDEFFLTTKIGNIWRMRWIYLVNRDLYNNYKKRIEEIIK